MPFRNTSTGGFFLPSTPKFGLPQVLNDFDLACVLGIKAKTMWWMIVDRKDLYHVFTIPKSSGGKRIIHAPDIRLKRIQKVLYGRFLKPIPFGPHVAAYVPGRGVLETPPDHVKKKLILHLDIKDFFTSTRQGPVKDMFRDYLGYSPDVASLLASLVTVPHTFEFGMRYIVPQGSPASGAVCNAVVDYKIDQPILQMLKDEFAEGEWTYSRYSDNVFLSTPHDIERDAADEMLKRVRRVYKKNGGYRLNEKKTRFQRPGKPQRVLGISTAEHPNIPSEVYRRLRAIIHNCLTHGPEKQYARAKCRDAEHLFTVLEGKLRYWQQVSPEKIAPLQEELHQAVMAWAAGVYEDVEVAPVAQAEEESQEASTA